MIRNRYRVGALFATLLALTLLTGRALAAPAPHAAPPPPANDNRDNATPLTLGTQVSGTTVGSTVQSSDPEDDCSYDDDPAGTVWYSISFGTLVPDRVGVAFRAGGNLDAIVDIYEKVRSQNKYEGCVRSDKRGVADDSFTPTARTTYLIRVVQRGNSDPGPFDLRVFSLAPPPTPPGDTLTGGHVNGIVDENFVTDAAYSMTLTAATTYKIDLVNRNQEGGCFKLAIFAPGTTSFGATPLKTECAGYTVFTPMISGRYSFLVSAADGVDGNQHFGLAVAPASSGDIAPGIPLANLSTYRGVLRGNVDTDVRLFSFDVASRSQLTLTLGDPSQAPFTVQLLSDHGTQIDSADGDDGPATLVDITRPGRYYVAVVASDFSYGRFSLTRRSQTITRIRSLIDHAGAVHTRFGQPVTVSAALSGADGGVVQFELQYFDPVFGWLFRGYRVVPVANDAASFSFDPPHQGHWRVIANYEGTRTAATSMSGYAELDVTT